MTTTVLREWAPLTDVLSCLPTKEKTGFLLVHDIELTCVDALPRYLAFGTNLGLVYWYDRKNKTIEKLQCESSKEPVTAVKVVSTVDNMVACGTADGRVNIFQIAVEHPDTIPESIRPKKTVPNRYLVSDLHEAPISALEWSKNGMKLFSGDKNGVVILTEFNYSMHISLSKKIINEAYEIVQLCCHANYLLVCTTYRSIVGKCEEGSKWKVAQVGQKDRKMLDTFGGIICQKGPNPREVELYCTRPGLRIWRADIDGKVTHTILFKELLKSPCEEITLINPMSEELVAVTRRTQVVSASFGVVLPFGNALLTYNKDVLYVLSLKDECIKYRSTKLRRILSVAVCKDEIFILEGKRSLIRLSNYPEERVLDGSTALLSSGSDIIDTATMITNSDDEPSIFAITSVTTSQTATTAATAVNVEEATEATTMTNLPTAISEHEQQRKLQIYAEISNQDFDDDILYRPKGGRHRRHRRRKSSSQRSGTASMTTSVTSLSSASSTESEAFMSRSAILPGNATITDRLLPDLRSREEIVRDIENKEKLLADVLCFNNLEQINVRLRNETAEEVAVKQPNVMTNQVQSLFALSSSTNSMEENNDKLDVVVEMPNFVNVKSQASDSCTTQTAMLTETVTGTLAKTAPIAIPTTQPLSPLVPICKDIPLDWHIEQVRVLTENELLPATPSVITKTNLMSTNLPPQRGSGDTRLERRITERSEDLSDDWEVI